MATTKLDVLEFQRDSIIPRALVQLHIDDIQTDRDAQTQNTRRDRQTETHRHKIRVETDRQTVEVKSRNSVEPWSLQNMKNRSVTMSMTTFMTMSLVPGSVIRSA